MNAKVERDQKQLVESASIIASQTDQISSLANQLESEGAKSVQSTIDEEKWRGKLENLKSEKATEVEELTSTYDLLKTKSKKLLLSQKQLLSENKSLKGKLACLSTNVQSASDYKSELIVENEQLQTQLNEALNTVKVNEKASHDQSIQVAVLKEERGQLVQQLSELTDHSNMMELQINNYTSTIQQVTHKCQQADQDIAQLR